MGSLQKTLCVRIMKNMERKRIARFGPNNNAAVIVFDEGYLEVIKGERKYPSGILQGAWPINEYNSKYMNGISNPFMESGEEWRTVAQKYVPAINESANLAVKHFEECESQVEYSYFSPPIPLSRYLHQMIDLH